MTTLDERLQALVDEVGHARVSRHRRARLDATRAERLFEALVEGSPDEALQARGRQISSGLLQIPPPVLTPPPTSVDAPGAQPPEVAAHDESGTPEPSVPSTAAGEAPASSAPPAAASEDAVSDGDALPDPFEAPSRAGPAEADFADFDETSLAPDLLDDQGPFFEVDLEGDIEIEPIDDLGSGARGAASLDADEPPVPPLPEPADPEDVDDDLRAFFDEDDDATLALEAEARDDAPETPRRGRDVRSSVKKLFGK